VECGVEGNAGCLVAAEAVAVGRREIRRQLAAAVGQIQFFCFLKNTVIC